MENDSPRHNRTRRCDFFAGIRGLRAYKHVHEYLIIANVIKFQTNLNEFNCNRKISINTNKMEGISEDD